MNILGELLDSAQGGAVQQASGKLGLGSADTQGLLKKLVPVLTSGIKRNTASAGGLDKLIGALGKGDHQRYLDDPAALQDAGTVSDGNAILGHLLGSKEVSRQVASQASAETGLDVSIVKRFLPLAAAAAMGAMSKQTAAGNKLATGDSGGALEMLSGLLDSDGDGQVVDNLLSLGKKLF